MRPGGQRLGTQAVGAIAIGDEDELARLVPAIDQQPHRLALGIEQTQADIALQPPLDQIAGLELHGPDWLLRLGKAGADSLPRVQDIVGFRHRVATHAQGQRQGAAPLIERLHVHLRSRCWRRVSACVAR
ncbi:hypothetical protein D3C85_1412640 [compost metagenome]